MEKVAELVAAAAAKVGVEAARVWPEMVRYRWVTAVAELIGLAFATLVLSVLLWRSMVLYKRSYEDEVWLVAVVLSGLLLLVCLGAVTIVGPTIVGTIIAPEASLVRSLLVR